MAASRTTIRSIELVLTAAIILLSITHRDLRAGASEDSTAFTNASYLVRVQQSYVAKISCGQSQGTAFIIQLPKIPRILFAVTNKHVLRDSARFDIGIPFAKEAGVDSIVEVHGIVKFYSASTNVPIRTGATVTWPNLDIGAIMIGFEAFAAKALPAGMSLRPLGPENFTRWEDLIPGFPLGISVAAKYPLIRYGMISGVDPSINTIYIDGQFFDGSSGSPVFLENRDPACQLPYGQDRYFVGVVTSYKPYMKYLINPKTDSVEMVQTENSGIGVVIPSAILYKLLTGLEITAAK